MKANLVATIFVVALAFAACSKKNDQVFNTDRDPGKSGDLKGSNDPSVTGGQLQTKLIKNLSGQDQGFKDEIYREYTVLGHSHCYQLVERAGSNFVQISAKNYDTEFVPGQFECKAELRDQKKVIAEFRAKPTGVTGLWRLTTDFGNELGSFIENLADNEHLDSMTHLCSAFNDYNKICRIENDGNNTIKAIVPVN